MVRNIWPIWTTFFYVFFCDLIEVKHLFIILECLSFSFTYIISFIFPYAYVSVESVDSILLWSLELKVTYNLVYYFSKNLMLCLWLLSLYCVFRISLFFTNSLRLSALNFFFVNVLFIHLFVLFLNLSFLLISHFY